MGGLSSLGAPCRIHVRCYHILCRPDAQSRMPSTKSLRTFWSATWYIYSLIFTVLFLLNSLLVWIHFSALGVEFKTLFVIPPSCCRNHLRKLVMVTSWHKSIASLTVSKKSWWRISVCLDITMRWCALRNIVPGPHIWVTKFFEFRFKVGTNLSSPASMTCRKSSGSWRAPGHPSWQDGGPRSECNISNLGWFIRLTNVQWH